MKEKLPYGEYSVEHLHELLCHAKANAYVQRAEVGSVADLERVAVELGVGDDLIQRWRKNQGRYTQILILEIGERVIEREKM